jgi:DNA-binding transcriptional LysR family regulator
MTLQQLKYIIAVADKHSINEAAKCLYISQPSLSAAIKELELELNILIFIRTNRGVSPTPEGEEFLGYARQVVQQAVMIEERYSSNHVDQKRFSVSTQHYTFVATAFVNMIKKYSEDGYRFALRETKTYDVITDVRLLRSELGILFLNNYNKSFISKLLKEFNLEFSLFFETTPHVFISQDNPLSERKTIHPEDLIEYSAIVFEQGDYNSSFYSEEALSSDNQVNTITVSDRALVFDLILATNAYTITTGIYTSGSVIEGIVSIPLDVEDKIQLGVIHHRNLMLTDIAKAFWNELDEIVQVHK